MTKREPLDVIVVGAGFAGLYTLHLLRSQGWRVKVFEAAPGMGGTWYWNRYPGARCDAQSLVYCFTFDERLQKEWTWSERYCTQPEILRYINFVADRLDLRKDIAFNSSIAQATFDEASDLWTVVTESGETASATYLVMASGALSVGRLPDIPGIKSYTGRYYHTSDWPDERVCLSGKRVAVIGTGSSGVQAVPLIAKEAAHLTVFQRTAAFVAPARNALMPAAEIERFRENFPSYRAALQRGEIVGIGDVVIGEHLPPTKPSAVGLSAVDRQTILEARWEVGSVNVLRSFADVMTNETTNAVLADFFRAKIREVVKDPKTAEVLTPKNYPVGSKRICVGEDYYETFNRENVTLIDLNASPIEAITPVGVRTSEREYEFDVIVFATGFDAVTGALTRVDIRSGERSIREEWVAGPRTYLGVAVAGFPNLFTITGPGSPSILGNVVVNIEQHVEWITSLLGYARAHGFDRIEADSESQERWTDHVTEAAAETLFMKGKSWYLGANVPGKPRVFMAYVRGIDVYRNTCDEIAREGYRGFRLLRHAQMKGRILELQ